MSKVQGICVVGRLDFETGYGRHTLAALEIFSRFFNVKFRPSRNGFDGNAHIILPSGRSIERASEEEEFTGYFFADIPWNGFDDNRKINLPKDAYRVAHLAWDSSQLPSQWVRTINSNFDLVLFTSSYLLDVAKQSGVTVPIELMPLGLDLSGLLSSDKDNSINEQLVFGSLSAYHPRKNLDKIVEAFVSEFSPKEQVTLKLHSNLSMNEEFDKIQKIVSKHPEHKIQISHAKLNENEKDNLIKSFDIYINASSGEGFSIGPREALAAQKTVIISDVPGQNDLRDIPSVVSIETKAEIPAIYPELSNQIFGNQRLVEVSDIRKAMRKAYLLEKTEQIDTKTGREFVSAFNIEQIKTRYFELFKKDHTYPKTFTFPVEVDKKRGFHGHNFGASKLLVPLHDAGYFSIFNVYLANLVWSEFDDRIDLVVPDWRANKLLEKLDGAKPTSFCYSRPEDGNLWNLIYEPLPGLTADELEDEEFLTTNIVFPQTQFVEDREPLLTYVNAFDLYQAPWFSDFRKLYNRVLRSNIRLRPEYQKELDSHLAQIPKDTFRIAAHVRHPSHAIEQPNGKMAGVEEYCDTIDQILVSRGIEPSSDKWEFFVASDNQKSINAFVEVYGERVKYVKDVERVDENQIREFENLNEDDQLVEGHQIQHLKASDYSSWSHRNVFEVWRDAELLAASDVLLHAVSNVATAVSYMNPEIEMVFCNPKLS
ncbi:glycosyltransferase [Aurantimicrobium minutum]|uniref:glycosyltransferase n=1 Tax=Aurantimicrobium minutum TaxID=708131 RepID=UPI0024753DE4|nr:glycosyltransferase [Aurantimicrobium minutum]MDH6239005.1 glycosyltransferase involved in cell wall biosynthesis [Aurantimicrobium minutum]